MIEFNELLRIQFLLDHWFVVVLGMAITSAIILCYWFRSETILDPVGPGLSIGTIAAFLLLVMPLLLILVLLVLFVWMNLLLYKDSIKDDRLE